MKPDAKFLQKIQELKDENKRLKQKCATFDSAFKNMDCFSGDDQAASFVLDANGIILSTNTVAEQLFGFHCDKLKHKIFSDFIDENFRDIFESYIKLMPVVQKKCSFEIQFKTQKEDRFSGLIRCEPVPADGKSQNQIHLTVIDHSKTQNSGDEISARFYRHQWLEENSPNGFFQISKQGRIIFINRAMASILGYDSRDDLKKMPADLFYEKIGIQPKLIQAIIEKGMLHRFEREIRTQGGSITWISIELKKRPLGDHWFIQGTVEDVNCRKMTDELLRVQEELSKILICSTNFDESLTQLLEIFLTIEGVDCGGIYIFDQEENSVILKRHKGLSKQYVSDVSKFGREARETQAIFQGESYYRGIEYLKQPSGQRILDEGITSFAVLPVHYKNELVVSINLASRTEKSFPYIVRYIIDHISSQVRHIIGRLWSENELKESEENFRALAANANDGIIIAAGTGEHDYVNKRVSAITGFSQKDLMKMSFRELGHQDELPKLASYYKARLAGEEVVPHYETRIVHKNGDVIPIEVTAAKTSWRGKPADIVIIRDVSHRKRMEEALKESEKRYRAIVEDQTELIGRIKPDGTFTFVNNALCKYYDTQPGNVIGKDLFGWFTDRETKFFKKKLHSITRDNPVLMTTRRAKSRSGKIRWQQWSVRAIFDEVENCTEYQFVGRDITKLKLVQNELKQHKIHLENLVEKRTRRLQDANKHLQAEINVRKKVEEDLRIKDNAMNTSINAIALADLEGLITYVNPACLNMLNYENENQILGIDSKLLWFSTSGKNEEIKQSLLGPGNWMGDLSVKRKDGSVIDVHLSANIVKDRQGNPTSIMASFIDISQLKFLKDQLIRSERLAATGQLAISVAHEINSPLQAITILLSMLKKNYSDDANLLEKITLLKDAHTSIRDTVQKLLHLNRPRNVEKQWIDVNKILDNTVSLLGNYIQKHKINLNIQLSENLPKVHASPQQINQVFLNLVNNSIEALSSFPLFISGTFEKQIGIKTYTRKSEVVISVEDNGPGISEEDIEHIFDPFYTSKKQMGVGVGLTVCHAIVESHHGKIEAKNLDTGGAAFKVKLPIAEEKCLTTVR